MKRLGMIKLKCEECGVEYEKPADFKKWNDKRPNVYFRWNLTFCDICRKNREKTALKRLPEVIKALALESKCTWMHDIDSDTWECCIGHVYDDGAEYRFCPYCGREIEKKDKI